MALVGIMAAAGLAFDLGRFYSEKRFLQNAADAGALAVANALIRGESTTDAEGVLTLVDRTVDAERLPLPYGFVPAVWKDIVSQVVTLRALLEDDESQDEDIEEHAQDLRDTLRNYV